MIAAPLSPALSCLKVWASSLLNRTTINTTTVQIKHIFLNFTQIVFFVFPIIEQLRVRWVMRPISTIYCCSFCFKVQFRIARVQRCTVLKSHCTLLRRHVKVQHTFTVARVQVEWRLVSLQNTAVDCIRQFGNCNYVALLKQEYMWSGYVSKERKRVLLTPIFANQPAWEDLGAQDVMGLPGQSLLLQFSGNIFF